MFRRILSDDEGSIAPMAIMMLVVLVGFCSFAIDVGTIYANRRALQNAADAAALAGAKEVQTQLLGGTGYPANLALSYAAQNGVTANGGACPKDGSATVISSSNTPGPIPNSWQIDTSRLVPLTFGGVIGVSTMCVSAHAVAVVVDVNQAKIWPWGILGGTSMPPNASPGTPGHDCQTNANYCFELKEGAGGAQTGNFGILNFPVGGSAPGACPPPNTGNYDYWSQNGFGSRTGENVPGPIPVKTWTVCTTPGNKGAVNSGLEQFITDNTNNPPPGCAETDPPDLRCPLIGLIPILQDASWPNGNSGTVTIVRFAIFRLVTVASLTGQGGNGHKEVVGEFLQYARSVGPTAPPDPQGNLVNAIGIRLWQ